MERTILFIVLFLVTSFLLQGQCEERYITPIFDIADVTMNKNLLFGTNEDYKGDSIELLLDIYYPTDDWLEARPVIMVAHGGAFVNGSKNDSLIYVICTDLAKRGFVAVPFSYRLDNLTNLLSPEDMTEENIVKAAIRGIQDGKAAVRYIRQTTDVSNPYKIDTSKIYMLGISAGGLIATHMAYLDDDDELPENWPQYLEDLDGWGGTYGNEAYSSHIDGVINAAGALGNPEFIDEDEVPIVSFHSVYDPIVPYHIERPLYDYLGSVPEYWPLLYGSEQIHKRANLLSIDNKIYTFCDDNHVHYNPSDDYTLEDRLVDYAKLYEFLQLSIEFLSPYLDCQELETTISDEDSITVINELGDIEILYGVVNDYSKTYIYNPQDSTDCFIKCITTNEIDTSCIEIDGNSFEFIEICEIGISADSFIVFKNCYTDTSTCVGINKLESILPAQVYPNPVQDILTIRVEDHNPYTWKLYEQTGRLIRFGNGQGLTQIERGNLSTGMYYLQLESENRTTTKKIIFQ